MIQKITRTTCSYCSVGCNFDVHTEGNTVIKMVPADHVVNEGKCCPKGFNLAAAMINDTRLLHPLVKDENGVFQRASWDTAIDTFTSRLKNIQEKYGKNSAAFISTGQMPTQEMALLGAVGRIGMGMHGDGNTRQCMASAVVGYKQAFGFDSPPFTYADIAESDCVVLVGANPVIAHPIIWNHFKKNKNNPELIVIDPRKTQTAKFATQHLALTSKTDLTLFYTVANVLIENKWLDKNFIERTTNGFEEFKKHVASFTLEKLEAKTGITSEEVIKFAKTIHTSKKVSFWWTMGVNQSHQAVRTIQAIINICLMTGNIGRPGTGPNSITGQANAMGSRLHSNTTALFGGRDFTNENDRKLIANLLDIDPKMLPEGPTKPYDKIIEGVGDGTIKALWIVSTNPLHSWVDLNALKKSLKNLELLVVQDLWEDTVTAEAADIVLPAAGSLEKPGFFINSERRFGVYEAAIEPVGESLSDFEIIRRVAKSYKCYNVIKNIDTVEKSFAVLKAATKDMPCDITGIKDWEDLKAHNGIQWPYTSTDRDKVSEVRRLFEDGKFYTPDKKAKFLFEDIIEEKESIDMVYPFRLLTGRGTVLQFHTQTRTRRAPLLQKEKLKDPYCEINEKDADTLGVKTNDMVTITSRRGECTIKAIVGDSSRSGYVFIPMHYAEANLHTISSFDPFSREPSFKTGAVNIQKAS